MGQKPKQEKIEIKYDGRCFIYEFRSLKSLQAETANETMQWYNDAKKRQQDVNLKEIQRSDLAEVKDTIVAHLVREQTNDKKILPYDPDLARSDIKKFMTEIPFDKFGEIKDEIIKHFFFIQGKSHLATTILREKPKQSLSQENLLFLTHLMSTTKSKESQEKKSSESAPLTEGN